MNHRSQIISVICLCLLSTLGVRAELRTDPDSIFRTRPYLQNPSDGGITVTWLTRIPVYSWVEYGTDTLHLKPVRTIVDGLVVCNNHIHKIRLDSLEKGKTYYYRVCSREILEYQAYSKTFGRTAISKFYSFRLPDDHAADFTAIIFNDLHRQFKTMAALCRQIERMDYDFVLFNGDCIADPGNETDAVRAISFYNDKVGASYVPVFYLRGNHEIRNAYSLHLKQLFDYPGNKTYGAFNWGDTRFVFLDCGEDKPDDHWVYYGLNDFSGLRREQTEFLHRELASETFRQAGKKVLIHHIPLYGNDSEYTPCLEMWGDMLQQAPFNVSLNAHTHIYASYLAGTLGNAFPVVIGGGYDLKDATVMVLTRKGILLTLKVLNAKGKIVEELEL